jgi:hypothetical protein
MAILDYGVWELKAGYIPVHTLLKKAATNEIDRHRKIFTALDYKSLLKSVGDR